MQAQTNFLSAAWKWSNQGTIGRSFPSDLLMGWRVIWRLTESLSVVKQTTVRAHVFWLANNAHSMTTPPLAILTAALNLFDRFTEFFCSFFYFIIIFFMVLRLLSCTVTVSVCQLVIAEAGGRYITPPVTDTRRWSDISSPMVSWYSDWYLRHVFPFYVDIQTCLQA